MIYVVDTSSFVVLKNYYPGTFATLWGRINKLAADGTLVSVREVFRELQSYNDSDFIQDWAKEHRPIFAPPASAELAIVQQILAIPHFQTLIGTQAILKGTPVADPFLVAAAVVNGATVVTEEKLKPNAAKIPNVCARFGVACLDLQGFMADQGWTF